VYTVAYPFGATASDGVGEQTRKALASLDERLAQAGTDKSNILDATIFLGDMSAFAEMDAVWREYIPDHAGPSRATVGVELGGTVLVEMKIIAAAPPRT
jgi:enamine deaminase RidA (YjgF/YER057c/UK114 family)